ncbi:MAG: OmpA family protein [Flavobacterium sp.]|nr:OmpA family protein [Flavobacterium sp.]
MKYPIVMFVAFLWSFQMMAQEQFSVYFATDSHQLSPAETASLNDWINANKNSKILGIHGFTDEDGSTGYNDTLAKKRVDEIYNQIAKRVTFREDFRTRSFGEKHQLSAKKSENRKVTLFYIEAKDLAREDEILGIAKPKPVAKPRVFPKNVALRNPDGTVTEFKLDTVFMRQIDQAKPGEMLKLEDLNFRINTFAILPESRPKLYELLIVLQDNQRLKVEIQGHLCCMPHDRTDLSTQRAKAIYNFLVSNKISKSRLSYKGFGSTQPKFPIPEKNEAERAANRRVEILIVEN